MTRAELLALAARVEAAAGADREMDAEIWRAAQPHDYAIWEADLRQRLNLDWDELRKRATIKANAEARAPKYTASLDAAASLVPEDWYVCAVAFLPIKRVWHVVLSLPGLATAQAAADTEQNARTAAALRAMAEEASDE